MEIVEPEIPHLDLIEESRKGNVLAARQLYQLYSKAMFNICLRMLGQREEAEDVLQDAFISAFQNLNSWRMDSGFGSWLKQIVINKCINCLKKRKLQFAEMNEKSMGSTLDEDDSVDLEYETFQIQQVKYAMMQLSDGYRTVLNLYLMEGYDHREISEILGITESTSKSQYKRAKEKLKEILKNLGNESRN